MHISGFWNHFECCILRPTFGWQAQIRRGLKKISISGTKSTFFLQHDILAFFASYCPYYWDTRPKFSFITEKRKGELKINLDLLLTNCKLLPTGKSDPSKKMLQHNQLENCGEQVFVIENLLFLECMLLKKIGKQVPFRKCLPPGVYEVRNMFKEEKMFKLSDCPGSFS